MRLVQSKDTSVLWTCFLIKVVGLWLAADRAEQQRRNFALIYTTVVLIIATCIAIRDIYFSWGNFGVSIVKHKDLDIVNPSHDYFALVKDCVYIACNILYLMIVFFKIAVLYVHKLEFFDLILFTYKNFWHSDYNPEEKLILADCRKVCAFFLVIISFCAQGTCAGYLVTPVLANIGKNESERVLPFNMWIKFPTGMSPYFEILFVTQILCVYHVGLCYICFDNFLCLVNLHVASQFRILRHRLKNLNDIVKKRMDDPVSGNDRSRQANTCYVKLRGCVQHHQALTEYCKKLENVFSMLILGQVLFLGIVICLVGCQIFLVDSPPSRRASLMLNISGTLCQAFIFTYSCDGLNQQNASIGTAIFSGPWSILPMSKTGRYLRRNVIIIIMRSNRSCSLTAGGFFPVSLETYTAILSTAMSYFTILRQSSQNVEK